LLRLFCFPFHSIAALSNRFAPKTRLDEEALAMKNVNFGISTKFRDLVQKEPSIALRESTVFVT
jgi:hypothetical protein